MHLLLLSTTISYPSDAGCSLVSMMWFIQLGTLQTVPTRFAHFAFRAALRASSRLVFRSRAISSSSSSPASTPPTALPVPLLSHTQPHAGTRLLFPAILKAILIACLTNEGSGYHMSNVQNAAVA